MSAPARGVRLTAGLAAVALVFLGAGAGISGEARLAPMTVVPPLLLLLAVQLRHDLRTVRDGVSPEAGAQRGNLLAWIVALPALVTALGLVAGPTLYVVIWLRAWGRERLGTALVAGATTGLALWLLLHVLLRGAFGGDGWPFWMS